MLAVMHFRKYTKSKLFALSHDPPLIFVILIQINFKSCFFFAKSWVIYTLYPVCINIYALVKNALHKEIIRIILSQYSTFYQYLFT